MTQSHLNDILERIHGLQTQLEDEFDTLLKEKQKEFRYRLEKGEVLFEKGVSDLHLKYRTGVWEYLTSARVGTVLTAPVIYSVIFPLALLDLFVSMYQWICFPVYGIPKVKRGDYIALDRDQLAYLNTIEKINCLYCGYGNGMIAYVREIIARTEQYWCPIKHARKVREQHERSRKFADYGDAEHYRERLEELRKALQQELD